MAAVVTSQFVTAADVLAVVDGLHGLVMGPLARHLRGRFRCASLDGRGHGDTRVVQEGVRLKCHPEVLDDLGHLGPLQRPRQVAESVLRAFG